MNGEQKNQSRRGLYYILLWHTDIYGIASSDYELRLFWTPKPNNKCKYCHIGINY